MTKKNYERPEVSTIRVQDLLAVLGPARAIVYEPGDGGINVP